MLQLQSEPDMPHDEVGTARRCLDPRRRAEGRKICIVAHDVRIKQGFSSTVFARFARWNSQEFSGSLLDNSRRKYGLARFEVGFCHKSGRRGSIGRKIRKAGLEKGYL
jgi:hypothetical protein